MPNHSRNPKLAIPGYYRAGEAARITGIGIGSLHYLDTSGKLCPRKIQCGRYAYRMYSADDILLLKKIKKTMAHRRNYEERVPCIANPRKTITMRDCLVCGYWHDVHGCRAEIVIPNEPDQSEDE